jgi:beta-lactamase regulating signal transducer with metallopeptidase domain
MIAGWLVYCLAVSALLAGAAACADALLTRRGRAARWVWSLAIAGSIVVPGSALLLQQRAPSPLPRAGALPSETVVTRAMAKAAGRVQPARSVVVPARPRAPEVVSAEALVTAFMIACIVLAGLRVIVDSVLLYRRRRRWTPNTVDGVPVLISDDLGPAIVGLIEPVIVLPRWTLTLDRDERVLMLAHETEHLRARDGQLTTAALLTMIAMPWNPVAWWLLRRLRTAIEVDCDRRVLRAFPDISRYGRLLVEVAQRAVGSSFAVAGFSERAAPLARRIQAMTTAVRPRRVLDMLGAGVGACALAGAITVLPPAAPARELSGYRRPAQMLPKNVGDSIAEGESPPKVIAAATNLPASFAVVEYGLPDGKPLVGRCAQRLRDERDDTRLLLSIGRTSTALVVQRADTAWTSIESLGYYMVRPAGRYGVSKEQTLRVGCGAYTRISVGDRDLELVPSATLGSPADDRARLIGARLSADLGVTADEIELGRGRLNIVFTDSAVHVRDDESGFTRSTFGILRDVLGAAAVPETLAVITHLGKDRWSTSYYYRSMMK